MEVYVSKKTKYMINSLVIEAVNKWEPYFKLPKGILKAMIKVETSNFPFVPRIEHHLKKAGWYKRTIQGIKEIRDYHYCSFGPMQIMFGVARHNGYKGTPFELMNPDIGIKWGSKYLLWQFKRYKWNLEDAIAAYNQGNNRFYDIDKDGIKDPDEKYHNQQYVDKVMKYYKEV